MKFARSLAALALALCATHACAAEKTTDIMHQVYDAIAYLLPLSVRNADAKTEWDKELVESKLKVLTKASGTLVKHADKEDAEFRLLARSFDRLVQDIGVSFRAEWPDYAYYSLMELTDHCVACPSRLPSASQDLFGQRLMARMNVAALEPESRTLLYVATRQFDAALSLYEEQLANPEMDPVEADYRGMMVRYLRVALSTGDSSARVAAFLDKYRERKDLPYFLTQRIDHWREALRELGPTLGAAPDLAQARRVFDRASTLTLAPGNRLRAVEDLVAARLMRTWLAQHPAASAAERGEIYYKLGIVALRTSEPEPAVPEMEMLLAASIEADPKGPHAKQAYALLEEYGYIHDEHLARQSESQVLVDMAALRKKVF